ncbi:MAG: MFS transporter [Alicyclobacillus sp.]|nr:MFS transporter [Alicyclobacillus sp.]
MEPSRLDEVASLLRQIQGNARTCVLAEPLFVIPFSMYTTYASVYMLRLHVTPTQIGLITTLGLIFQIFSAMMSGYLTDRMGRRNALWVFDVVSWSCGTLFWALSQNFWWFVLAAILNSFQRIPTTAWYCLLVEDTPADKRTFVFRGLQFVSVLGGMFAPIGGILIHHFTLVPAVRIMYAFACVSMSTMIFVRQRGLHETDIGLRKRQESQSFDLHEAMANYTMTIRGILQNRTLLLWFSVYVLWNIQASIQSAFTSVFQVAYLDIPASLISLFPAITSVTTMALLVGLLPRFREEHAKRLMAVGFSFLGSSYLLLTITPKDTLWPVLFSTVLAAAGTIIANPYVESVVANAIDDERRATMLSVLNVLILVFTSPAGIIAGWTYGIDPRIPMWLIVAVFGCSIALLGLSTLATRRRMRSGSRVEPQSAATDV